MCLLFFYVQISSRNYFLIRLLCWAQWFTLIHALSAAFVHNFKSKFYTITTEIFTCTFFLQIIQSKSMNFRLELNWKLTRCSSNCAYKKHENFDWHSNVSSCHCFLTFVLNLVYLNCNRSNWSAYTITKCSWSSFDYPSLFGWQKKAATVKSHGNKNKTNGKFVYHPFSCKS